MILFSTQARVGKKIKQHIPKEYVNDVKHIAILGPNSSGDPIKPKLITANVIKQNTPEKRINFIVFFRAIESPSNSVRVYFRTFFKLFIKY